MKVMDMGDDADDDVAYCDGGDVMYTGRHLFVGLSGRTNDKGFQFLQRVFGEKVEVVAVPPVIQGRDVLHLKSAGEYSFCFVCDIGWVNDYLWQSFVLNLVEQLYISNHHEYTVTHLDEETILAPTGPIGDTLLQAMLTEERGYTSIRLPDILSCNAVTINGHVLAQDACEVSKELIEKACAERGLGLTFVDTSELAKKDAALTCCSVLLSL
jgi:dimethylargininase